MCRVTGKVIYQFTRVPTGSWTEWLGAKGLAVWDKSLALIWTGRGGNALRNDAAPRFTPAHYVSSGISLAFLPSILGLIGRQTISNAARVVKCFQVSGFPVAVPGYHTWSFSYA